MTTIATTSLYSSQRLRSFFEPESIALVGASEKSIWSLFVHSNLRGRNFPGEIYYVNPRSQTVHGQPTDGAQIEALDALLTWQRPS